MPNWAKLLKEINQLGSPHDILRRKYAAIPDLKIRNKILSIKP